jgi:hypothetical protein
MWVQQTQIRWNMKKPLKNDDMKNRKKKKKKKKKKKDRNFLPLAFRALIP